MFSFYHPLTQGLAKPLVTCHSLTHSLELFDFPAVFAWLGGIDRHILATMYAVGPIVVPFLISLVASAYVAPRDGMYLNQVLPQKMCSLQIECYNITTSTTYTPLLVPSTTYTFPNTTSAQQCQVTITSWVTTTATVAQTSGYLSSSPASTTITSSTSKNAPRAIKRTTAAITSSTNTTIDVNSILSEFVSIYSVLTQLEYNSTANVSTATSASSINISTCVPSGTSYCISPTTNSTSTPTSCALSCPICTTIFYYPTTTITKTTITPPPSPLASLPPITLGTATYTATNGAYYVIGNSTLSPGGFAILVSNSTLLSLSPSGTQLVIAPVSPTAGGPGPSTYDLSPDPASSPPLTTPTPTYTSQSVGSKPSTVVQVATTTITGPYNLPVVVLPSWPIVIAGTTLIAGASSVTIRETPVSLAPSSAFLVVGSSTISLAKTTIVTMVGTGSTAAAASTSSSSSVKMGSMIWSGIGGTEPTTTVTTTAIMTTSVTSVASALASATTTSNNASVVVQLSTGAGVAYRGGHGNVGAFYGLGLVGWACIALAGVLL